MRTSRAFGLLSAAATLAVAGLLGAQTVDPFSLTTTDTTTTDTTTILPGLITVASVEPASDPVVTPDPATVTRPGRSP